MRLGYDLTTEQSQRLLMNPVMLAGLRILAMPVQELGALVEQTLLENPVLEEESPFSESLQAYLREYYTKDAASFAHADADDTPDLPEQPAAAQNETKTLAEALALQLRMSDSREPVTSLCRFLIDSLDESGFLPVTEEEILSLTRGAVTPETIRDAVALLQSFDPPGIGARDVAECLQLQLARRGEMDEIYGHLIGEQLTALSRNRIREIARDIGVSAEEIQRRADVIRGLSPIPGSSYADGEKTVYLLPDVFLEETEDGFRAVVNERLQPQLRVSAYYESVMRDGAADEETRKYLQEKVGSAVRFLRLLALRKETVRKVAQSIADHQTDFLRHGAAHMKPLSMRAVAEDAGVHVSTVSRTVRGKYMACPGGLYELRSFFGSGLGSGESGVSAKSAKALLARIFREEDRTKPYSDETVAGMLRQRGIAISRRTVAKYRTQLGIPGSSERRRY